MKIGSREWSRLIIDGAAGFDIEIDDRHTDQFSVHAEELIQWTQRINITTITDPIEVAIKHFVDSLAPAKLIPPGSNLLDIGSGGGFPGIPLKVLVPSLSVALIDASRKKISFLKHVVRMLNLDGIEAHRCRAEALAEDPLHAKKYDIIISRALTSLESFFQMALPLLAKQGCTIALKGGSSQQELADLQDRIRERLNPAESNHQEFSISAKNYSLPFIHSKRSIISVRLYG